LKKLDEKLLPEIIRRLAKEFQPLKIIVFGSRAWGKPHDDSDLDILVVIPASDELPAMRAMKAHLCLAEIPVSVDILVRTPEEIDRSKSVPASLFREILERGRVIYG